MADDTSVTTPRIAVVPGDGIGVDVTAEAMKVIRAVAQVYGRAFDLEMLPYGADYYLETGISLPPDGYAMFRDEFDAIYMGVLGDPRIPDMRHARDILLGTRFELDLYLNHRPVTLLDARLCPLKGRGPDDVNFVVFRENTEGLYVNIGGRFKPGTEDEIAVQEEINTYKGVSRIVRHAFAYAAEHVAARSAWRTRATRSRRDTPCGFACSTRWRPSTRRSKRSTPLSMRWRCNW